MIVSFVSLDRTQVDAFKEHFQVCPAQGTLDGILPVMPKRTLFQSFAPDAVAASVKVEYFGLVTSAVNENKQLPTERVLLKLVFDQGREAVIGLAHIGGAGA